MDGQTGCSAQCGLLGERQRNGTNICKAKESAIKPNQRPMLTRRHFLTVTTYPGRGRCYPERHDTDSSYLRSNSKVRWCVEGFQAAFESFNSRGKN